MLYTGLATLTAGDRPAMTAMTAGHDRRIRQFFTDRAVKCGQGGRRGLSGQILPNA